MQSSSSFHEGPSAEAFDRMLDHVTEYGVKEQAAFYKQLVHASEQLAQAAAPQKTMLWTVVVYESEYPSGYVAAVCTSEKKAHDVVKRLSRQIGIPIPMHKTHDDGKEIAAYDFGHDDEATCYVKIEPVKPNVWDPKGHTDNSDIPELKRRNKKRSLVMSGLRSAFTRQQIGPPADEPLQP